MDRVEYETQKMMGGYKSAMPLEIRSDETLRFIQFVMT